MANTRAAVTTPSSDGVIDMSDFYKDAFDMAAMIAIAGGFILIIGLIFMGMTWIGSMGFSQ